MMLGVSSVGRVLTMLCDHYRYSASQRTVVVGDARTLRLFHAENASLIATEVIADPGDCIPYTISTLQNPAAANDTTVFNCSQFLTQPTCPSSESCAWNPQRNVCVPQPFYSTCNGNVYYFATSVGGGASFVVCSALGQCQHRSSSTLALISNGPTVSGLPGSFPTPRSGPGPQGWFCGVPEFAAVFQAPTEAATVTEEYCPVWRYGPAVPSIRQGDTAVGVVATDPGLAGSPEVLYMLTSREEVRDNGGFGRLEFVGSNRADELTKRSLSTFSLTGCVTPTLGMCSPLASPQSYFTQSSAATIAAPSNLSHMYTVGNLNTYVAGWTLGDWVYFAFQECVSAGSGACSSTVGKLARFCRSTPTSATSPGSVSFNGFRKVSVGCGGRTTIVAAHSIAQPPPSVTDTLGFGAVMVVVACDTDSSTGVRSNFAVCLHKLNGTAVSGSGASPTVDAAFTGQYGSVSCATQVGPVPQTGGLLVGSAQHSLLVYTEASEEYTNMEVDSANGFVALYMATASGSLIRLVLNGPTALATSWTSTPSAVLRMSRSTIASVGGGSVESLALDTTGNGLIIGQLATVNRHDLVNCSLYSTCAACIGATSIYCGWCPQAARCTTRQSCVDANSFSRSDSTFSGSVTCHHEKHVFCAVHVVHA